MSRIAHASVLAAAVASVVSTRNAGAADDPEFRLNVVDAKVTTSDSLIKAALMYDSDGASKLDGALAGLTFKLPATSSDGNAQANLDDFSTAWRLGAILGKEHSFDHETPKGTDFHSLVTQFEPEWGIQTFKFFPAFATNATSSTKHSLALAGTVAYYDAPFDGVASAWQLRFRVNRDWEASESVGMVTPATADSPAVVRESKVLDGPKSQAAITVRLFHWREVSSGKIFALGPTIAMTATGPKGNEIGSLRDTVAGRAEVWLYYTPSDVSPANLRIGISPTITYYFNGESDDHRTLVPGAQFQVKLGAPLFVY